MMVRMAAMTISLTIALNIDIDTMMAAKVRVVLKAKPCVFEGNSRTALGFRSEMATNKMSVALVPDTQPFCF